MFNFWGTGNPMGDPYPRGYEVNSYPPVYMGDPMRLFFCRGYEYGVVIPSGYLPIAMTSNPSRRRPSLPFPLHTVNFPLLFPCSNDGDVIFQLGLAANFLLELILTWFVRVQLQFLALVVGWRLLP
jgi:hypothetical protein